MSAGLLVTLGVATPLSAQLEIGTWRRQAPATPAMTLVIQACCNGGRRLTYHVPGNGTETLLVVESKLDGSDAPVMIDGRPSGETMAITRVDAHHATTVVKMNGQPFATSDATLSADGKTLTVHNNAKAGGPGPAGSTTEVWVKQ